MVAVIVGAIDAGSDYYGFGVLPSVLDNVPSCVWECINIDIGDLFSLEVSFRTGVKESFVFGGSHTGTPRAATHLQTEIKVTNKNYFASMIGDPTRFYL